MTRLIALVLGVGAGAIAARLIERYLWAVIDSGHPGLRNWVSGNGMLPFAAALVTFVVVFVAVFGSATQAGGRRR